MPAIQPQAPGRLAGQRRHRVRWRGRFLGWLDATSVRTPGFVFDIREALILAEGRNAALMCAEKHPRDCHRATKLAAWVHRKAPSTEIRHLLPEADDLCEVLDSRPLEESLDPRRIWWELHPAGT